MRMRMRMRPCRIAPFSWTLFTFSLLFDGVSTDSGECLTYEKTLAEGQEMVTHCYSLVQIPADNKTIEHSTTYLDLNGNSLSLSFGNGSWPDAGLQRLKTLRTLDLSNNRLVSLGQQTLSANERLEKLVLAVNLFRQVPTQSLSKLGRLSHLDLSRNLLSILRDDSFVGLSNLTVLNLEFNQIALVQTHAFVHLPNLRILQLSFNNLTTLGKLPEPSWHSLQALFIGGNPLLCDCALLWLKAMLSLKTIEYDKDHVRCFTSPASNTLNKTWEELNIAHFACAPRLHQPPEGVVKVVETKVSDEVALLSCTMWSSPKQNVFWTREVNEVRHSIPSIDRKYEISISPFVNFSTTLRIKQVSVADAGRYACQVSNEAGSVRGEFLVVVDESVDDQQALLRLQDFDLGSLIVIILGVFIIAMLALSTALYCWYIERSAKRTKKYRSTQKATLRSKPKLDTPKFEPIKASEKVSDSVKKVATISTSPAHMRFVSFDRSSISSQASSGVNRTKPTVTFVDDVQSSDDVDDCFLNNPPCTTCTCSTTVIETNRSPPHMLNYFTYSNGCSSNQCFVSLPEAHANARAHHVTFPRMPSVLRSSANGSLAAPETIEVLENRVQLLTDYRCNGNAANSIEHSCFAF